MKKLLLLLIAMFLAMSAYAECTFFVDPTEFEITENNIENGDEIFIPIHANFSARVSAWELTITYPEGMTAIFLEGGPDFSIEYTNARGRTANLTPPLYYDETYTSILSANASEGYYLVDGNWVSYGAVKWEAGGYDDFLDLYVVCDENFHGGDLVMTLRPASASDARGGTIAENGDAGQSFITTTTLADPNNTAPAVQYDVNGDGEVNIADLNAIINAILTGDNINSNMDVNGDAEINIADCNAMINIILYRIDDNPHVVGQPTEDHLFVRNTYGAETVDNVVNFKDNETQLVWVWLDDDMIYMNEAVQYLDPMAYNSSGSLYNEITYNSLQCDIYLPQGFAIVNGVNEYGDYAQFAYGDRMPTTSYLTWSKKSNTKIIDGIEYNVYTLIIYNYNSYGSHFSAKNAKSYQNNGCLKKDAAPLFGIYLTHAIGEKASGSELGDMLIANQEFYIGEAYSAGWPPNEYRFFYGTGGNNVSQRIQSYNRVKLVDGEQITELTETPVINYELTDDAAIITATGNGHVCLYIEDMLCAEGEDFAQYVISRTEYDQEYNVSATAQAAGKEVSEFALATVYVPAIQITEKLDVPAPVIETGMDDDNVYVTIIWPETDGDQVYTGEYTYSRTNEDQTYEVEAYTTETEIYKESEHAYATILVPAKESPSTGDIVFVAGIDNGTSDGTAGAFSIEKEGVKIEVSQGLANASQYRIYKSQTLRITSTVGAITKVTFDCVAPGDAQYGPGCFSAEPGDYTYYDYVGTWSGESESITFTAVTNQVRATRISVTLAQSGQTTPMPEITTSMTDNSVVVTATGEGEVKLYINGVAVSNPYAINRGTEDKTYTATATAQADGMVISETARATIEVPKMDGDGSFLYINDYQIPTSKLGGEIVLPLRAHFDARVSGWLAEMTFPEGITPVYCEAGGATTVTYLDARGNQQTVKAAFTPGPNNTNIISYLGTSGFWMPEGATDYESYGVVKWEAGDYGEMALIYCEVDPDFTGGQLIVDSEPSAGSDARGGTTAPGQHHTYTTTFTIGGQELAGEILIGECDANGKVPVTYTGTEDVTLDVMIDGQSAPLIDGMVQLKHYGRTIVSAEVTAIGYEPLHATAEVNWVAINNGDWEILKAFYNQYKNDVLVWDMSDRNKPGSCPGVSSENGRVTAITLPNHELEGGFPTMLLGLDKLTLLDLSYNNLSGDAAADMTQYAAANGIKAKGLQQLYIHHNDFTGNVGALAALFSKLETLNVSNNHFAQVDPMVNPAVNLSLNDQLLEMDGDINSGIEALATSLPPICLYDHTGQSFEADVLEVALANNHQSPKWYMTMYFYDGGFWLDDISSEPYRGANGETIDGHTALSCDYWDNKQQLQVNFIFNPGDANINGPVDITDLQAIVNYIFGDYGRRFNFTAANLNNDAIINVQDVVGEANLLLSMELTMPTLRRAPSMDEDIAEACLYWEDGTLYLSTTVPVTALDIVNDAEGDITWNVSNQGFVVKNATSAQGAHAVIYSLGDAVIEPGVTAIATTSGCTPSVVAAKLSNADAELVGVRLNDRLTGLKSLTEDGKPQCHFDGTNLVIFSGTELSDVDIDIYSIDGIKVWGKHMTRLESGNTSINLSEISSGHRYLIIVVRNGRQIIATQKLTQIR